MPVNVLMPALSPTMEKGKLAKWLKKEGDAVKSGDILAEIETDKATMEVEAVDEGKLGRILVAAGTDDVLVNTPIAVILGEGETAGDIKAANDAPRPAPAAQPSAQAGADKLVSSAAAPAPEVRTNRRGREPCFRFAPGQAHCQGEGHRPGGCPGLRPTWPHRAEGRRVGQAGCWHRQLPRSQHRRPCRKACPTMPCSSSSRRALTTSFRMNSMRKVIARRLTESKQTIPHFYVSVDVSLDRLLELRERLNLQAPKDKDGKHLWKVSVNDFIIKAMAMALIKVPDANVSWTEHAMVKHKHADIGVAVSIPGGLITPVIRKAETKGLAQISAEMKDYAARARVKKLKPEEYTGGSAAVSNLGMMNVKNFAAIVNPPHATILAVGTGERRPVVRGHEIVIEQQMTITLSTDHRCVDGALGAEFIGAIKMYLEEPGLMLV